MNVYLLALWTRIRANLELIRGDESEAGYSTETVVITAILAALALLVVGTIIYNKVVTKASDLDLN